MAKKKKNNLKNPAGKLNKELDKYADVVLFPEKVKKADHIARTVPLPKLTTKRHR